MKGVQLKQFELALGFVYDYVDYNVVRVTERRKVEEVSRRSFVMMTMIPFLIVQMMNPLVHL